MLISGSCHCQNISFVLEARPEPSEIPARACTCTFCTRHGGVWTSFPAGSLTVKVRDPSLASRYSFGTKTADFHVCTHCGVVPVVTSSIDGRLFAVVNVNTFDDVDPALLRRASSTLDDEEESTRLARRARNWIGDVVWIEGRD
ncbi:MAG: GFA family protein [Rhodanobacteraceae bacterium]